MYAGIDETSSSAGGAIPTPPLVRIPSRPRGRLAFLLAVLLVISAHHLHEMKPGGGCTLEGRRL